jgi:ribosomal-protein-alanine N-acetyltransferase
MIAGLTIAPFTAEALESVFQIELAAGDTHWSRSQIEQELTSSVSRFFVLKRGHNILGYGCYWKVHEEAQIANLAVAPSERRQGNGHLLVTHMLEKARAEGCRNATLEVRGSNQAALALYRKAGFTVQGTRSQRYTQPPDDAVLMEKQL